MKAIYFTSVFLIVLAVLSQFESSSLTLMNILFVIGNVLVIFMVFTTLKDLYHTTKKFDNWYGDNSRKIQE